MPETNKPTAVVPNPCELVRAAIEKREFLGWRGLPAECAASDIVDGFPADLSDRPTRSLGSKFAKVPFVLLELAGYYRPMVSVAPEGRLVFDAMNPDIADVGALLSDLGEPSAKLDWTYGTLPFGERQWVYPDRGITLFLNSKADRILHLALYGATTLEAYRTDVEPPLAKKPLPRAP